MKVTTDGEDPDGVTVGAPKPIGENGQHGAYYVLDDKTDFVRPYRDSYVHTCGALTKMNRSIAETYAKDPKFYGSTFCVGCRKHFPVSEFLWDGTKEQVGS